MEVSPSIKRDHDFSTGKFAGVALGIATRDIKEAEMCKKAALRRKKESRKAGWWLVQKKSYVEQNAGFAHGYLDFIV